MILTPEFAALRASDSILNSIQVNFDLMNPIILINKEIHRISDAAVEVLHIGEDN